jgi:flagellin-like hook-associated protein FlgL
LSAATTVEDVLNAINGTGLARAQISSAGTGIEILNPISGTALRVSEAGGTTAGDLGIRTFSPATGLAQLNGGKGVRTTTGADLNITRQDGTSFAVDLNGATTVQDAIDAINAADAGGGVTASFATNGNGIVLTDSSIGAGALAVASTSGSSVAADLGLTAAPVGGVINGTDVNGISTTGVFSNLAKLRDALLAGDTAGITAAAEGVNSDSARVIRLRGTTGARVQELDARKEGLKDRNVETQSLLSSMEDVDYTEAIARFQTLQTALDAALMTSGKMLSQSLLDFLA